MVHNRNRPQIEIATVFRAGTNLGRTAQYSLLFKSVVAVATVVVIVVVAVADG